jgi:DNA mismatch repair ATPase MutS
MLAHGVVLLVLRPRLARALDGVGGAGRELALLARLLGRVERETFSSPRLMELAAELRAGDASPSVEIARLERLVDHLESRKNPLFAPIAFLLVWTPQLALATEAWRARVGPRVARWFEIAGEVEALAALSGHAYEHPEDPFADILDGDDAVLDAEGLGHPIRPATTFVRNDLRLGDGIAGSPPHPGDRHRLGGGIAGTEGTAPRALIVSGSNMSGKSTFLRTVGVNTVLGLAGAPVRARRMRLSRLAVGASIQIHDSLAEGQSRFYAEILRLRQILALAKEGRPLLFLLDEILHGTNSHDRRIGAEAVIRSLLRYRTVGLVTTHDLALARIAEDPALAAENVHFEDEIVSGRMLFDYRVRPGVVKKSNALELMREVGLEV